MNPRAEKILKQLRELPMTDVQEVLNKLKYAEEWIYLDEKSERVGSVAAVTVVLACVREDAPVTLDKDRQTGRWHVYVYDKEIGNANELKTAQDIAESELELLGYYFPWRRGRA